MLIKLFKDIKEKKNIYSTARNGDQFEQKFINKLKKFGFSQINRNPNTNAFEEIMDLKDIDKSKAQNIFKKIRKKILLKNSIEWVKNPFYEIKNAFIFQPYGSQNFPDFIIFWNKHIIPIELKYSKNEQGNKNIDIARPKWNSNIPKSNSIYIYGVATKTITFFLGSDIIRDDTRKVLLDFWDKIDKKQKEKLDEKLKNLSNNFGIYPYVRVDYQYKKTKSTFINLKNEKVIESYFSKNVNIRENNVIEFLENLNKKK